MIEKPDVLPVCQCYSRNTDLELMLLEAGVFGVRIDGICQCRFYV